ncbi:hypothetical protein GCM10011496_29030 [Polaromonas eurypsychrophila]|uniref:Uncharacterized protein n=1 Tax=Polaromonas eurypsychrophila TaxID=1614635 RepID=A0A916SNN4_9BURK|nr:hypothetical protein GCM10011496_29030 [Polaromonas eurypsychrophila]
MLVSDTLTFGDTYLALAEAAKHLGREVNPTILTPLDFARRRQGGGLIRGAGHDATQGLADRRRR